MQSKTPFLFSMPPLFAWPLAVTTGIALLLAAALLFGGSATETETATPGDDEAAAVTRQPGSVEQAAYLGLLIVPVGLIPVMARRKRMNAMRWSIAGVAVGFVQLVTQIILVHPLMVLLALVYLRPAQQPAPLAAAPDMRSPEAQDAGSVDTPPSLESAPPARRRPPRRRRRPRF